MAKSSADVWKRFLINGSDIPEIGVCVDGKYEVNSSKQAPLTGKNGEQIKAEFGCDPGMIRLVGSANDIISVPPTYEVRTN